MAMNKSVDWLQEQLESGDGSLLLLDCRSHELYESSHIDSAINVIIPGLMLRRLKKGNLPIKSLIPNNEDKEKFVKRCKTDTVILYDDSTIDWHENGTSSVLGLLLQKLRDDGCKAYYLEGEYGCKLYLGRFNLKTTTFHVFVTYLLGRTFCLCFFLGGEEGLHECDLQSAIYPSLKNI